MSWLSDLFNPPAANLPPPPTPNSYQPTNLGGADVGAFGGIGNLGQFNTYANLYPQVSGIAQGLVNNPYAPGYQAGAGTASTLGQNAALGAYGQGQNLFNMAGTVANTAFDPQSALYNRTVQQLQDQQRAANAAAGVATTPYGAGLEGQTLNNFNIDWNNQQLQRQLQGANAYGSLTGQGVGLQQGASPAYYGASGLPYSTFQGMGASNLGTLGTAAGFGAQGAQIPQQQVQDYLSYLGWGTGAQSLANQAAANQWNQQLAQDQAAFSQQQGIFGGLGKAFGGLWGTGMPGGGTFGGNAMSGIGNLATSAMAFL